ncbi:MAG TPA: STAS domain-containing protein [Candidatus Binataceae bacterium]|nr:STAS domain-containing protein [Candidatus Binataceae bacterium]
MEITEKREGDLIILRPIGQLDNDTSPEFQDRLLEVVGAGDRRVLVDFSGVDYISSAGLRALMTASKKTNPTGRIAIAALNAMVKEIYQISRFTLIVPAYETMDDARTALMK